MLLTLSLRTLLMICCRLNHDRYGRISSALTPARAACGIVAVLAGLVAEVAHAQSGAPAPTGLTSIPGIKVGHHTLSERPTGCTVVLVEAGAVAGVDVRGAAPGTRETDLLDPVNMIQQVHAFVLSGGSAFGLSVADGVMRFLEENGIGVAFGGVRVPIVPAAVLFDLSVGERPEIRPGADCGYQAALSASSQPTPEGNVGAGAGATVGKLLGMGRGMKSGIGSAAIRLPDGLIVAALVAVNAVGDVIDPSTGQVVAGARTEDGNALADIREHLRGSGTGPQGEVGQNTTLAVVATNARLSKAQTTKIAQMAHDGFARAIYPAHTTADGDAIFALSTGGHEGEANLLVIGALAADVVAQAILRAVRAAEGIPGFPSVSDLANR